jgi:UrcA family protein
MKLVLAAALTAVLATPAAARIVEHGAQATTTIAVSRADLDLGRDADARAMLNRLDRAALSACGASSFSALGHKAAVRRTACYHNAMNQAVASADAPAVGAIYRESAVADR